ncbi:hypothetical protein HNQ94_001573 [Salirhabdus euzebyi]|uniref:Uncharacterized protein n=1 Tax=Salirhabdus euzebyi TaxID=394506 RepID=A0A841Q411_9BACI|nr:hypothetical protein [Salirhabdus euzebyi]MBB6453125.1 hypothetical protein [Salirhabdus euzebyi]
MNNDYTRADRENPKNKNKDDKEETDKKNSFAPYSPVFTFNEFKVGTLENASAINFGNNYPTNFKGYKKHNQGLGTIDGNNNDIHDLKSQMNLKYLMDMILEDEGELPDWVIEMIEKHNNQENDHESDES